MANSDNLPSADNDSSAASPAAPPSAAQTITLAFTGASGMQYGLRLLDSLLGSGHTVWLLVSQAAHVVLAQECAIALPAQPRAAREFLAARYGLRNGGRAGQLEVFGRDDWMSPVASGSGAADAMVICPCTMGTLGAIAAGLADNLIERAADVMLKERRPLVLVPRETPLSVIHLENMLRLARAGAVILPPSPGFYTQPAGIDGIVDFVVAKILDQLHIPHALTPRWGRVRASGSAC
jgi:4-hydroxy-3-polyprenylbenzoate decarboxylase